MTHYQILEVSPKAAQEVIKAAYKALVLLWHPDHKKSNKVVIDRFNKELNEAYKVLSDPDERQKYDQSLTIPNSIGNYEVIEHIADGGYGSTFRAKHKLTDKLVCIKEAGGTGPEYDAILIKETQAIWDLKHPSLPVMHDLLRLEDGGLALIQSFIPGMTLEKVIGKVKKIEPENVAWMMDRLLNSLSYLHDHGVLHGDLKPQNIIIEQEYHTVTMVDFGLATIKKMSNKGYTPLFSPPEQIAGKQLLPASDLYSLGMTVIFALTGDLKAVENRQVPSNVPESMFEFIKKLTKPNVLDRFQHAPWHEFKKVRVESFGREMSGMLKIEGL